MALEPLFGYWSTKIVWQELVTAYAPRNSSPGVCKYVFSLTDLKLFIFRIVLNSPGLLFFIGWIAAAVSRDVRSWLSRSFHALQRNAMRKKGVMFAAAPRLWFRICTHVTGPEWLCASLGSLPGWQHHADVILLYSTHLLYTNDLKGMVPVLLTLGSLPPFLQHSHVRRGQRLEGFGFVAKKHCLLLLLLHNSNHQVSSSSSLCLIWNALTRDLWSVHTDDCTACFLFLSFFVLIF